MTNPSRPRLRLALIIAAMAVGAIFGIRVADRVAPRLTLHNSYTDLIIVRGHMIAGIMLGAVTGVMLLGAVALLLQTLRKRRDGDWNWGVVEAGLKRYWSRCAYRVKPLMNLTDSQKETIASSLQKFIIACGILATVALVLCTPWIILASAWAGVMPNPRPTGWRLPRWLFLLILFSFYPLLGAAVNALCRWSPLARSTKGRFFILLFFSELYLIGLACFIYFVIR